MAGRPPQTDALKKALAWFRTNGPEASLSACIEGAGVSIHHARQARRQLQESGELSTQFSVNDPRGGPETEPTDVPVSEPPAPASPSSAPPPVSGLTQLPVGSGQATTQTGEPPTSEDEKRLEAQTLENALDRVLEGAVEALTPEQARQLASEMLRHAPTFQLRLAALREINRLNQDTGHRDDLGPGLPLTIDQRLMRATPIFQACGPEGAREVWKRAFGEEITKVLKVVEPEPLPPLEEPEDVETPVEAA